MKALKTLKVAVFALLLFFMTHASAQNFILNGDNYIVDQRAQQKILEIANEVKTKTNTNIYLYVKNSYGMAKQMPMNEKIQIINKTEEQLLNTLQKPYALLTISVEDVHVNLITSKKLESILDKNDILNGYVIPLLASKDKNQLYAKVSAAVLNGYAQIADEIAKSQNIKLESSIGSQGKLTGTIWKVFMYSVIIIGILLYTFAVLKRRK